jgi:hypothetical protein
MEETQTALWRMQPERTVFLAKAAWGCRQAAYSVVQLGKPETPALVDWEECPDATKDWMCNEANAMLNALAQWDRRTPPHPIKDTTK